MYRCDDKVKESKRDHDFKVRNHIHYFRPGYDEFLKELIEHPRIKLGVQTSITRKNAMPLLMHIFNKPNLTHLKDKIFGVFD